MKRAWSILIILGAILLTAVAHEAATAHRGYRAIGGEFLIAPLIFVAMTAMGQATQMIKELKKDLKGEMGNEQKKRPTTFRDAEGHKHNI